jgi:tetratricopeptide (TPR) repeat protein
MEKGNPIYYNNQGLAHVQSKLYEEAEKCFRRAIELNHNAGHPSDPTICFNLANVHLTLK